MSAPLPNVENSDLAQKIFQALQGLDYGTVEIVVQDGRVVQIERRQKTRFSRPLAVPVGDREK